MDTAYKSEWRRRAYAADPEKQKRDLARAAEWRRTKRATDPAFRERERETAKRAYLKAGPEKHAEYHARWYQKHREEVLEKQHAYYKANKIKLLGRERERKYGIPYGVYLGMRVTQGDKCAICGRRETLVIQGKPQPLAVDHDHETGRLRGLLCSECNLALGGFRDDPARLRAAADYLEAYA